ncbi:MAG: lipopolysaccharide heptosyltransferase II [Pyrinomonadaceae bacterium]
MVKVLPKPDCVKRIVVRGATWIGDAVMTVPALRELRRLFPRAHITLATYSGAQELFLETDFIDELLIHDQKIRSAGQILEQAREWRGRNFDMAVIFPNSFAAALIPFAARVSLRVGYSSDGRRLLLTHPLSLPAWRETRHEAFYYLNIIHALQRSVFGVEHIQEREPVFDLRVSEERQEAARSVLRRHGANTSRPLIALCPGSTNSRAKRWPAERYAALADGLIEDCGVEIILIGSKEELDVSESVASKMRRQPITLTGGTNLAESIAVLSLVELLITNDTGPAHIAAALNRPVLAVFGPTNPLTTYPFSASAEIIRRPPACAPCMLRDCPIDHRCMTSITSEEVYERAHAMIARARSEFAEVGG